MSLKSTLFMMAALSSLNIVLETANAHIPIEIDQKHIREVKVSRDGLTRISVEGEQITDMFAYPGDISNSLNLHESGHLFVAPIGIAEPVYLTIMTGQGHTQDLKLQFVNMRPQPIILKTKKDTTASKVQIEKWMTVALLQEVPMGFRRESTIHNRRVTKDTIAREIDRFSNGSYDISVLSVKSRSDQKVTLNTDMYLTDEEAGLLATYVLAPQQSTRLVIIKKRRL